MRIYANCTEMHSETTRNIHEMGIVVHPATMQDKYVAEDEDYRTLELSPAVFSILDGRDRDEWLEELGKSLEWARGEFEERWMSVHEGHGVNPGEAWKIREETWGEFIHQGKFAYTYSKRFGRANALRRVINELDERPETRQAYLPMFNSDTDIANLGGKARIPCTIGYQFLRRPDGLRCFYTMRSSDFIEHFPYDVWLALEMQAKIADLLGITPGRFTFFTGSLHIYAKDADEEVF